MIENVAGPDPAGKSTPPMCLSFGAVTNTVTGEVHPLYCKRWCCPRCGPKKVRQWVIRVKEREWSLFLTVTLPGSNQLSRENLARLSKGWRNVKRWLARNGFKTADWLWVRELGERFGGLHQHVMLAGAQFIPVRRLRRALTRNGLGKWCHISRVKKQHAARVYVSKYLAKTLPYGVWPKHARRVQTSIPRCQPEPGLYICSVAPRFIKETFATARRFGQERYWLNLEASALENYVALGRPAILDQERKSAPALGADAPVALCTGALCRPRSQEAGYSLAG